MVRTAEKQTYASWAFASENVQSDIVNGEYVSAESTLILGGPARLDHLIGGANGSVDALSAQSSMFPIGIVQDMSVSQNRPVQRIFEIGSKRAYFVPGRLFANFSISRVLFYGPSLLRMLYAVAPYEDLGYGTPFQVGNAPIQASEEYASLYGTPSQRQLLSPPGYGSSDPSSQNQDFFVNLASDLFNVPVGICMMLKDPKNNLYGAEYLEDLYIEAHSMTVSSGNIIIMEGVSGQFGQVAPIQVSNLKAAL